MEWDIVRNVSSGMSLAALLVGLLIVHARRANAQRLDFLKKLPAKDRALYVESLADTSRINIEGLTREKRAEIALKQLEGFERRAKYQIFVFIVAMILSSIVAIVAIIVESQKMPMPQGLNPSSNIENPVFSSGQTASEKSPIMSDINMPENAHDDAVDENSSFDLWTIGENGEIIDAKGRYIIRMRDEGGNEIRTIHTGNFISIQGIPNLVQIDLVDREGGELNRSVLVSGELWKLFPCVDRGFFAKVKGVKVDEHDIIRETSNLRRTDDCREVDKQLVIWSALKLALDNEADDQRTSDMNLHEIINAQTVVSYNYARALYNSCIKLGYMKECDRSVQSFQEMDDDALKSVKVSRREAKNAIDDIAAKKLMIAYASIRRKFSEENYLDAARDLEVSINEFEDNKELWARISITKSSLYFDAAVSWYNKYYIDSVSGGNTDARNRCLYAEMARKNGELSKSRKWMKKFLPNLEKMARSCALDGPKRS